MLLLSLVQMAPTTINKYGSQWAKPGPKTSPSTDTAPPTGKYGHHQLNTIQKSISKEGALMLAEKLHILNVMQREGWNQLQIVEYFNTVEGHKARWLTVVYHPPGSTVLDHSLSQTTQQACDNISSFLLFPPFSSLFQQSLLPPITPISLTDHHPLFYYLSLTPPDVPLPLPLPLPVSFQSPCPPLLFSVTCVSYYGLFLLCPLLSYVPACLYHSPHTTRLIPIV